MSTVTPFSADDCKRVFEHIVVNLLRSNSQTKLYRALRQHNYHTHDPSVYATLLDDQIKTMTYTVSNTTEILEPFNTNLVLVLRDFIKYKTSINEPIPLTLDGWLAVTPEDFYSYQISGYYPFQPPPPTSTSTSATGTTSLVTTRAPDAVTEFKKGIKRDPSLFPELKHEHQWDSYN